MPTNLVKTESDERLWRQAKALAAKNGHKENWGYIAVSYTHLRAHETPEHLVCRLLLEKNKLHISQPDCAFRQVILDNTLPHYTTTTDDK